jgi:hypothetical protein
MMLMTTDPERLSIDLSTPLSIRSSFRFPLQSAVSRREVLWGAALIALLPGVVFTLQRYGGKTTGAGAIAILLSNSVIYLPLLLGLMILNR